MVRLQISLFFLFEKYGLILFGQSLRVDVEQEGEYVVIDIEDNAGGIDSKIISKIFTTKKEQGGTGLGLYIAKIIIEESMQGSLGVINTELGAKFKIKLLGDLDGDNKETQHIVRRRQ